MWSMLPICVLGRVTLSLSNAHVNVLLLWVWFNLNDTYYGCLCCHNCRCQWLCGILHFTFDLFKCDFVVFTLVSVVRYSCIWYISRVFWWLLWYICWGLHGICVQWRCWNLFCCHWCHCFCCRLLCQCCSLHICSCFFSYRALCWCWCCLLHICSCFFSYRVLCWCWCCLLHMCSYFCYRLLCRWWWCDLLHVLLSCIVSWCHVLLFLCRRSWSWHLCCFRCLRNKCW